MKHIIVDGYNVVRSTDRYRRLALDDLAAARARLVSDCAALADSATRITVVFDGGPGERPERAAHHVGGVAVVFSQPDATADDVIERLAARAKARAQHVVVVTSDAATQHVVMGGGAVRMSAREFEREVAEAERERRALRSSGGVVVPLEQRIDADVRRALDRWIGRTS